MRVVRDADGSPPNDAPRPQGDFETMKTLLTRTACLRVAALCGVALLAAALVGCQTPGKVVSTTQSPQCPMCKTETRTTPVKGLTYKKHVCPGCKTISETSSIEHYTGNMTTVHVCDHCKAAVTKCAQCASK